MIKLTLFLLCVIASVFVFHSLYAAMGWVCAAIYSSNADLQEELCDILKARLTAIEQELKKEKE